VYVLLAAPEIDEHAVPSLAQRSHWKVNAVGLFDAQCSAAPLPRPPRRRLLRGGDHAVPRAARFPDRRKSCDRDDSGGGPGLQAGSVAEHLSATEVAKETHEHAHRAAAHGAHHYEAIAIVEAVLLSVVTIVAAWSGYSAAKWEGESTLRLARASTFHTLASRNAEAAVTVRTQDSVNFGIWFNAYLTGDVVGQALAEHRFRPGYDVAFRAWLATNPFTNPDAPRSPAFMPIYSVPGQAAARKLDHAGNDLFAEGQTAQKNGEDYIRVTVILASVLFIVGIGSHFRASAIRVGLTVVGAGLLIVGAAAILQLPGPP
jgi:hypothetical protein